MSKQEKLISADKLLEWINYGLERAEEITLLDQTITSSVKTLQILAEQIEAGTFNPDTVPNIKPGETKHKCNECEGASTTFEWNKATLKIYKDDIYLIEDPKAKGQSAFFICPKCGSNQALDSLEVVENE